MKMKYFTLLIAIILSISFVSSNTIDPLKVEKYTLENGLTVYLNVDHTMPSVQGMVVVKGGAKRDPKDATGIAHYFEHIMFKGTDKIGTVNYQEEKIYLDSISAKYDELGLTKDELKRLEIQKDINRLSIKASDYAIPNEFDKIVNGMGGTGLNAGTSMESIVYYNAFPSNQITKWIELYSHRFINPVFRLFQSELETVYEEKNMYADNPLGKLFEEFSKSFYKNYPYGQQTVLGTTEDLKNPSLSKMKEYFDTYYVANNMALILSGDIDPTTIKPLIAEKFGQWKKGAEPADLQFTEKEFKGRDQVSKRVSPIPVGFLGFRTISKGHEDEAKLDIIQNILTNSSSTGLLDELKNSNDIMMAEVMPDLHEEIGGHYLIIVPKIVGQKLKNAEKKALDQIEKLKNGEFNDTLLKAIKINMIKDYQRNLEDMRWRSYSIMSSFLYNIEWEDQLNYPEKIKNISKEEIIETANKYFGDDYLAFYSKMGFPKKDKMTKPPYKPVLPKNSEAKSEYAKMIEDMPVADVPLKFIEFNEDVFFTDIKDNVHVYVNPNPINNVFTLRLEYSIGTFSFPRLNEAAQIIPYCGIGEGTYEEFNKEMQLLGAELNAYSELDKFTLSLSGLEENLIPTLQLFSKLLKNPSSNTKHVKKIYQNAKAFEQIEREDPSTISDALKEYALYGNKSNYINRLTLKEIKHLKSYELLTDFKRSLQYETNIHYSGKNSINDMKQILGKYLYIPNVIYPGSTPIERDRNTVEENTIYFINDKKAVQSQINLIVEGEQNTKTDIAYSNAFNEYFGTGMSSLMFQEIREYRSFAYGAYGSYKPAFHSQNLGYFSGYLSTQADKTVNALNTLTWLVKNMPEKPERVDNIKESLTYSINANRPSFRNLSTSVQAWRKQGFTTDPRKARVNQYENLSFFNIKDFYEKNIKDKPWIIVIVGNEDKIDMEDLGLFGKVIPVEKEFIFEKQKVKPVKPAKTKKNKKEDKPKKEKKK